ncbi:MAG: AAA family ATPase, partial [Methylococcaceae bacterium]|nr:AAA family ATPase [Methylococcaceae bacterium]
MAILEGIQIQNYRVLRDVTLGKTFNNDAPVLPRLMAIIGANGTGKSSLVDALGFLGDCLQEGVEAACDKPHRGGFERLHTQGSEGPIHFEVRYRQNNESSPIGYSLNIDCEPSGQVYIAHESLRQRRKQDSWGHPCIFLELNKGVGEVWSRESKKGQEGNARIPIKMSDRQVLGISTLGTLTDHPRISAFRDFLSGWYLSHFVPQLARTQPMFGADPHLDRTGENLAKYLQFVERENPSGFRETLKSIAHKIPGICDIKPIKA